MNLMTYLTLLSPVALCCIILITLVFLGAVACLAVSNRNDINNIKKNNTIKSEHDRSVRGEVELMIKRIENNAWGEIVMKSLQLQEAVLTKGITETKQTKKENGDVDPESNPKVVTTHNTDEKVLNKLVEQTRCLAFEKSMHECDSTEMLKNYLDFESNYTRLHWRVVELEKMVENLSNAKTGGG